MAVDRTDQPMLAGLSVPPVDQASAAAAAPAAVHEPVAMVAVDNHLAHLDRPFEYDVPEDLDDAARPGVRVRVRFAGRTADGYLLGRRSTAEHPGRLAPLLKVVSDEVVLTPAIARLCRELADHYAGTLADVLRLAIPPRHARAEKALPLVADTGQDHPPSGDGSRGAEPPGVTSWRDYPAGPALLRRLAAGESPRAAWSALPDAGAPHGWPRALAAAVAAVHGSGRSSIVVLPDHRDVDRLAAELDRLVGPEHYVRLQADLGPQQRYTAWLRALRGHVRVVIGSRSAAFAPVRDLGLVAWWDDGDDSLQEPRAPYPHVREVLRRRAALEDAGLLVGGYVRTPEIEHWVRRGDLPEVRPAPTAVAAHVPRITIAGEGHQQARDAAASSARLPSVAWRAVKTGLTTGPVLVQVPRRGYLVSLSCEHCRTPLRCASCAGPLRVTGGGAGPSCGWCGRRDDGHACRECGDTRRRSGVVGEERTAEEIGRAFPGSRVLVSRAGQVVGSVSETPAVVVATPGAEPVAQGGYAAALLLDGWAVLDRGGLDAGVEALRRWLGAAALTRAAAPVVLTGVPPHAGQPPIEALVRWDPAWLARRELDDRVELGLPPVRRTAVLTGDTSAVTSAAEALRDGAGTEGLEVLGPLANGRHAGADTARVVVRPATSATTAESLPRALRDLRAARSLRKAPGDLEVRLDPQDLDL